MKFKTEHSVVFFSKFSPQRELNLDLWRDSPLPQALGYHAGFLVESEPLGRHLLGFDYFHLFLIKIKKVSIPGMARTNDLQHASTALYPLDYVFYIEHSFSILG